jgi:hypothetical protein
MVSSVTGLIAQVTGSAIANSGDGIVVIDLIHSTYCRTRCTRTGQSAHDRANDGSNGTCCATGHCTDCHATGATERCAFLGVVASVIVNSMLYVVFVVL